MQLVPLTTDEASLERYVEELWLPYNRELAETVDRFALAEDVDFVARQIEFRRDRLTEQGDDAWVAVDTSETDGSETETDGPETETDGPETKADAPETKTNTSERDAPETIADASETLAGFVTATPDECPDVFDRPDRLKIGDFYVKRPYRGTGLAERLVARVVEAGREAGCGDVTLDVDIDNERAKAFYDKLGFEPFRQERIVGLDALDDRVTQE